MKGITQKSVFSATFWLLLLRWVSRGLGVIRTIVLAALLTPEEYGIGVLALTVVLFLEACTRVRANYLLIRTTESSREFYDAAWTLEVLRGLVMGAALIACAGILARFFEVESLRGLFYLLGISVFIGGLQNIGMAEFMRHLAFSQNFLLGAVSRVNAFVFAVGTAIIFETYWAIAVGFFVQRVTEMLMSYRLHTYRPRLRFSGIGVHFEHSKWLLMQAVLFQVILRLDVLVIGKTLGTVAVGPYHLAKMVTEIFGAETANAIKSTLFPAFSRKETETFRTSHLVAAQLAIICLGAPLCVFIAFFAEDIITYAFEKEWRATAGLISILSISAVGALATAAPSAFLLSRGLTRLVAYRQLIGVAVFVPLLLGLTDRYGLTGAASAVALTAWVGALATTRFSLRELERSWGEVFRPATRLTAAMVVFFATLYVVDLILPAAELRWLNTWLLLRMLAVFVVAILVFSGSVYAIWKAGGRPQSFEDVLGRSFAKLRRKLGGGAQVH